MTNTETLPLAIDYPVTFEPVRNKKTGKSYAFKVITPGWVVQVSTRSWASYPKAREMFATTRAYGALAAFVPGFDAEETRLLKAITNHDVKDLALAKFHRQSMRLTKPALESAVAELARVLRAYGFDVTGDVDAVEARFSQKAGCSMCPCSPGHILSETLRVNGKPIDLWFDEAMPPVEVPVTV